MKKSFINRSLEKDLDSWSRNSNLRPLLLKGARQVGKSSLVKAWGKKTFGENNFLEINLEERTDLHSVFERDFNVERIVGELELISGKNLKKSKFLLFIDEIQVVPKAIVALRYFFENMQSLHVIAAGSLIDFVLKEISFPVGRIDTLELFPLNFYEFLSALGKDHFSKTLENHDPTKSLPLALHNELLSELKRYYRIGGMPEAVYEYSNSNSLEKVSRVHERLVGAYKNDFAKYSKKADWDLLLQTFTRLPFLIGDVRLKYVRIDKDIRSYKIKRALKLLVTAGLAYQIFNTTAKKLPLHLEANHNIFKVAFLDIGLMQFMLGFDWTKFKPSSDLGNIADGKFAEQFVAQELISNRSKHEKYNLHYWYKQKKGSDAEVDFVIEYKGDVVPLEVKSGHRGTLKSLREYQKQFNPKQSLIASQRQGENMDSNYWIGLYSIGGLE